ncbi:MAG TPA: hypothetical protein VIS05_09655 [Ilumatobacter sp.]
MGDLLEREELSTGSATSIRERVEARPVPTAEELRAIVEGPSARRPVRWMRWLGALTVLFVAAAAVIYVLQRDGSEAEQADRTAGRRWTIAATSSAIDALPVERFANPPADAHLVVTQTPHGVSYDYYTITQTPHGVSFDPLVAPAPTPANLGRQWLMPATSPAIGTMAVTPLLNPPANTFLMVTQTPHGVSYDYYTITQTPHGVSFDPVVAAVFRTADYLDRMLPPEPVVAAVFRSADYLDRMFPPEPVVAPVFRTADHWDRLLTP